MREFSFPFVYMGPKVEAACHFGEATGKIAASLDGVSACLHFSCFCRTGSGTFLAHTDVTIPPICKLGLRL